MARKLSEPQKKCYAEGYRLGLYAGGKLRRHGITIPEPPEAKNNEGGK